LFLVKEFSMQASEAKPEAKSLREQRRERELAARRADVIAGASAVFAEKGFEAAQMSEIAARAEVSTASLYAMFAGKDELYAEVITSVAVEVRDAVRARVGAVSDPRERLLTVLDSLYACWEQNQTLLRIYARGTHGIPWRIREAMGERGVHLFDEFTAWVEELARDAQREGHLAGLDARAFSLALLGAALTNASHWIEHAPERPLGEVAAGVRALFERVLVRAGRQ
jgi:AcrR family transcriptional regulator